MTTGRGNISAHNFIIMGIEEVAGIIGKIADGLEDACMQCLADNSGVVVDTVREQLSSGVDGDGSHLSPTYLEDPYLVNRKTPWFHHVENTGKTYIGPQGYLEWKKDITPPMAGELLGFPPRPDAVPNLFIDGTFHRQINASRRDKSLMIDPGIGNGPDIVSKYGESILMMSQAAIGYFNASYMLKAIESFFKDCGYR